MLVNCKQAFLQEPYLPIILLVFFLRHFVKHLFVALFTLSSSFILFIPVLLPFYLRLPFYSFYTDFNYLCVCRFNFNVVFDYVSVYRAESSSDEARYRSKYYGSDDNESLLLCCGSQVQTLKSPLHIICLILNILLPGWGTMISASACTHARKDTAQGSCTCGTFCDGML